MTDSPRIPPADPRAGYLAHKDALDAAVRRVLEGGSYILGKEVAAFEVEFARYLGVRHVIGVGSGTDALHLALRAAGIGPGDVVFTVSHTAVATVAAIELAGATPLLVDIDPVTYTLDPNRLEAALHEVKASGGRPRAVLPVHLYGHPADMAAILAIARRFDLVVIEDCAQAHGARLGGRLAGTFGRLAAFSFYPTKNLGALGDGGALATDDADLADQVCLLREYGWRARYVSDLPGLNSRLDELQAAILRVKLPHLDADNTRRRALAAAYNHALDQAQLPPPAVRPGILPVYHQYVVRSRRRDELQSYLQAHAIGTAIHYPVPIHLQPAYRNRIPLERHGLPETEQAAQSVLSLPMFPQLSEAMMDRCCARLVEWREHSGRGASPK